MAGMWWDAGVVEYVGRFDASEFARRMLTSTAHAALWADSSHDEDTDGNGKFTEEIDDYANGYAPDYEDALPDDARVQLETDVDDFIRSAWVYLTLDNITPEQAGHDFELSRNGHGAGFWDRGYSHGDELHSLAEPYGTFGLDVSGHGEDMTVYGFHG
jgi:hypothetical protein